MFDELRLGEMERERERDGERETEREREIGVFVQCMCLMSYVLSIMLVGVGWGVRGSERTSLAVWCSGPGNGCSVCWVRHERGMFS